MRDYEEKSYYEIQLDNKQLILVFLAAVTVCVLIFVLGVMIGKGQKEAEMVAGKSEPVAQAQPEKEDQPPSEPLSQSEDEPAAEPRTAIEEPKLSAESRAPEIKPSEEPKKKTVTEVKEAVAKPLEKEEPSIPAKAENKPAEIEEVAADPVKKTSYTVQVIATSSKAKAEEQMAMLKARGHTPQLDDYKIGSGTVYKVRVGRFADSADAKALAARLKKELQIDTWVAVLD